MPDRAVVEWNLTPEERELLWDLAMRSYREDFHHDDGVLRSPTPQAQRDWDILCSVLHKLPMQDPQPRALVALSEDRQWLVVLRDGYWTMYQHAGYVDDYQMWADLSDTGQDAQDVLAQFLERRG